MIVEHDGATVTIRFREHETHLRKSVMSFLGFLLAGLVLT